METSYRPQKAASLLFSISTDIFISLTVSQCRRMTNCFVASVLLHKKLLNMNVKLCCYTFTLAPHSDMGSHYRSTLLLLVMHWERIGGLCLVDSCLYVKKTTFKISTIASMEEMMYCEWTDGWTDGWILDSILKLLFDSNVFLLLFFEIHQERWSWTLIDWLWFDKIEATPL